MFAVGCFKHKISDRDFGHQRLTASNKERMQRCVGLWVGQFYKQFDALGVSIVNATDRCKPA